MYPRSGSPPTRCASGTTLALPARASVVAPTAANRQPIQLMLLHTAGREEEIGRIYHRPWFTQAPLVIAVCAISFQAWVRESDRFNARL